MEKLEKSRAATDVRVRLWGVADLDAVMAIERAAFTMPWTRDTFTGLLRRTDTFMAVAEDPGHGVVGYAAVWMVVDQAELGDIAVDEPWRGRGIGRLLLEHVLSAMRDSAVAELFLEVRPSNTAARRLYEGYGFEEVGRRRSYYVRPVEDALVLRLRV
jgi:[ribosomal protein S18]-alanine N-acetyltransferase